MRLVRFRGPDGVRAARVDGKRLAVLASDDPFAGGEPTGETIDAFAADTLELPEPYTLLVPLEAPEVWCAGVTYERSRDARVEESAVQDVYSLVYDAERPELFLKDAAGRRTVGPGQPIGVRSDAVWNVPEPELALVLGADGRPAAVTIGNDVSSRDIEGANPLYLPQAKVFAGACSLGPALLVPDDWAQPFELELRVLRRDGSSAFEGRTSTARMRRSFDELVSFLLRDNPVPPGSVLLTGTGLVPPDEFTLEPGHRVEIHVPGIGTLVNSVVPASQLVERSLLHV
jgi:2-dehydro-3-deoxy-D-arabinonate dehydratase